jgi:hypothetical protein
MQLEKLIKKWLLLNIEPNVQVSDTTGGDSSAGAGKQKGSTIKEPQATRAPGTPN